MFGPTTEVTVEGNVWTYNRRECKMMVSIIHMLQHILFPSVVYQTNSGLLLMFVEVTRLHTIRHTHTHTHRHTHTDTTHTHTVGLLCTSGHPVADFATYTTHN